MRAKPMPPLSPIEAQEVEEWLPRLRREASYYGVPDHEKDDLVQDGVFGVVRALRAFDPTLGCQKSTYYILKIRSAMADGLRTRNKVRRSRSWMPTVSMDAPFDDATDLSLVDVLCEGDNTRLVDLVLSLDVAMPQLKQREREIVHRRLQGETLRAIGESWGVCEARACQIEKAARLRLRDLLGVGV